ncbi:MAG: sulfite exporter TauE/SafE family protein [Deltaproteobacteria bacterium]|nr:sulfite exporter TauE/SafE family protein [Deltaproteobacteria bacterium]
MNWLELLALAAVGLFAGVVNTIAGGGSLITLPALIFLGLPPTVANGTNRVGVILQSAVATEHYRRDDLIEWGLGLRLLIPTSLGAVLGAWLSVDIDEDLFRRVIGVVMLLMLVAILVRPKRWLEGQKKQPPGHLRYTGPIAFFFIGAYGGFLQAGVGIFLLAGLVLVHGRDLLRANAVKVLLVAGFTVPPLLIFLWHDLVQWVPALVLAVGSAVGGWVGARMTVTWGADFIRWALVAVVAVSASKLLGLW